METVRGCAECCCVRVGVLGISVSVLRRSHADEVCKFQAGFLSGEVMSS